MTATGETATPSASEPDPPPLTTAHFDVVAAAAARHHRRLSPRWVAPLFGLGAIVLLPWIIYLGFELPENNLARHWDLAWVGFDCFLLLALARTAWLAWRGRRQVELPALVTATLLFVDAWFDITTSAAGWPLVRACLSAALLEIPMALLALWIARHVESVCAQAERRLRRYEAARAAAAGKPVPPDTVES